MVPYLWIQPEGAKVTLKKTEEGATIETELENSE